MNWWTEPMQWWEGLIFLAVGWGILGLTFFLERLTWHRKVRQGTASEVQLRELGLVDETVPMRWVNPSWTGSDAAMNVVPLGDDCEHDTQGEMGGSGAGLGSDCPCRPDEVTAGNGVPLIFIHHIMSGPRPEKEEL